jgi:hypothetical protein
VIVRVPLLAALVLAVAAVVASPAAGAGTKRYAVAGANVSFAVPSTWVALNGSQIRTRALVEQLARENPRLAPFVRSFTQTRSPVKFVALDPSVKGGFATNVNVVSLPVPGTLTFEQYREALLSELGSLTRGSRITDADVDIGGNRALRLSYRFRLNAAGRTFTVQTLQYAFLRNAKSTVFTYTTTPRYATGYARTFEASARSIRFGG